MADLERFETALTTLIARHNLGTWLRLPYGEVAAKVVEFLKLVKACEDEALANPGYMDDVARLIVPRPLHLPDGPPPEPAKIEVLPATEDWCACGWSEEPHERSEHEPLLHVTGPIPCARFVNKPGEFAAGPNSICDRCTGTGAAHDITTLGPPTQIAETLTPLED